MKYVRVRSFFFNLQERNRRVRRALVSDIIYFFGLLSDTYRRKLEGVLHIKILSTWAVRILTYGSPDSTT